MYPVGTGCSTLILKLGFVPEFFEDFFFNIIMGTTSFIVSG